MFWEYSYGKNVLILEKEISAINCKDVTQWCSRKTDTYSDIEKILASIRSIRAICKNE